MEWPMADRNKVEIFTDGACKGNPGIGGWGALLRYDEYEKEIYGGEVFTTNNRMELLAAVRALETLKRSCRVNLHTDSQYLKKVLVNGLKTGKYVIGKLRQKNQ